MRSATFISYGVVLCGLLLSGCLEALEEQTKKSPNSIFGKKTDDIGVFDPDAKQKVSDSKVKVSSPVLYAVEAYPAAIEQISKSHIEHAVRLFHAQHERYPKDHDEFMREIIKKNNIKLPMLPASRKYQYNVEEHRLEVIVLAPAGDADGEADE